MANPADVRLLTALLIEPRRVELGQRLEREFYRRGWPTLRYGSTFREADHPRDDLGRWAPDTGGSFGSGGKKKGKKNSRRKTPAKNAGRGKSAKGKKAQSGGEQVGSRRSTVIPRVKFQRADPARFVAQRAKSKRPQYLTHYSEKQLRRFVREGGKLRLSADGNTGYLLKADGNLENVFNVGPFLAETYSVFGFKEIGRSRWDGVHCRSWRPSAASFAVERCSGAVRPGARLSPDPTDRGCVGASANRYRWWSMRDSLIQSFCECHRIIAPHSIANGYPVAIGFAPDRSIASAVDDLPSMLRFENPK